MTAATPAVPAVPVSSPPEEQPPVESSVTIDRFATIHIGRRVRRIARQVGPEFDRNDFRQEVAVSLIERLPRYDCAKARQTTFEKIVVDHEVTRVFVRRGALKRGRDREMLSLNEMVDDGEGCQVEFGDTLDAQINRPGRSPEELHRLSLDVAALLPGLSKNLQWLCGELMAGKRLSDIERESRRERHTLRAMVAQLRITFVAAAMSDYL